MLLEVILKKYTDFMKEVPSRSLPVSLLVIFGFMIATFLGSIILYIVGLFNKNMVPFIVMGLLIVVSLILMSVLSKESKKYWNSLIRTKYDERLNLLINFHNQVKEYIKDVESYKMVLEHLECKISSFNENNKKSRTLFSVLFLSTYFAFILAVCPVAFEQIFNDKTLDLGIKALGIIFLPLAVMLVIYAGLWLNEKINEAYIKPDLMLRDDIKTIIELSENKYKTHQDSIAYD